MTQKHVVCRRLREEGERRDSNPRPPGPQPGGPPQRPRPTEPLADRVIRCRPAMRGLWAGAARARRAQGCGPARLRAARANPPFSRTAAFAAGSWTPSSRCSRALSPRVSIRRVVLGAATKSSRGDRAPARGGGRNRRWVRDVALNLACSRSSSGFEVTPTTTTIGCVTPPVLLAATRRAGSPRPTAGFPR